MIVAFFRTHGKKSLQTLVEESKLALAAPMNMAFEVWQPFNDMIELFFEHFEGDYRRSELEKEVTTLISCFVGVGLTHDKLVEAYKKQNNFVPNLRCLLDEFCFSMTINVEELKEFIVWYLDHGSAKKKEEAQESTLDPSEAESAANTWLPYKTMYELFLASFRFIYSTHEIVRGAKLVISSLLHAGMIHDTMKAIYRQEMESESTNAGSEMKKRFSEILEHNFPKIHSMPIPMDDLANFLVHYCKKNFVVTEDAPQAEDTGAAARSNKKTVQVQRRKRVRKRKGNDAKVFRQVIARQEKGGRNSSDSSDSDEPASTDALSTCRRKLSAMLPKNEESDEYKQFILRFNSLFMVS